MSTVKQRLRPPIKENGSLLPLKRFLVVIVLLANSAAGGKASLVIGSRKNVSGAERNVQSELNGWEWAGNGRGYPVYRARIYESSRSSW